MNIDDYDSEMISYVVDGEILSKILAVLPLKTPAKQITIGKESALERLLLVTPLGRTISLLDSFFDHSINSITKNLDT